MEEIYIKARAKVNLNLEITGVRDNGYHNIESDFQKINLYDELYIKKTKTNKLDLQTNIEELNNEENIICKAYIKMREIYKNISGVQVKVNKRIPMQAGLAGGSTDCASFILGMNKLFDLKLSKKEIENIGKSLGADVVPCLYNQAVKAEGIGEIITPINTNFKYYLVIIKPKISCNTKEMYKKIDEQKNLIQEKNTNEIIKALEENKIELIAENLYNVFESVVDEKKLIQNLKKELIENGAIGSLMAGSGSCVFGIFENKEKAKSAYKKLKNTYQTYICTSFNSLRRIF